MNIERPPLKRGQVYHLQDSQTSWHCRHLQQTPLANVRILRACLETAANHSVHLNALTPSGFHLH